MDPIAERVRKIGGSTIKSIGQVARLQRVLNNDADYVDPEDMLAELCEDNKTLAGRLGQAHNVCDEHRDFVTTSLIENWIDEAERRTWFLFEASRRDDERALNTAQGRTVSGGTPHEPINQEIQQ